VSDRRGRLQRSGWRGQSRQRGGGRSAPPRLIGGAHYGITPWRVAEKSVPKKTGTRIECWHSSSGHRNQARRGLQNGRRDAILRGTTQLRFRSHLPLTPSPGRRFGFYGLVEGRPLARVFRRASSALAVSGTTNVLCLDYCASFARIAAIDMGRSPSDIQRQGRRRSYKA
jgi:hypothetical protein